ncbi:hypothetical protein CYMTET_28823, partial [Cymbomonas tetramitiformis]
MLCMTRTLALKKETDTSFIARNRVLQSRGPPALTTFPLDLGRVCVDRRVDKSARPAYRRGATQVTSEITHQATGDGFGIKGSKPTGLTVDLEDVLRCPNLRSRLTPRPSPFQEADVTGFVSDDDRVLLQAVHYSSQRSSGATCLGGLPIVTDFQGMTCIPLPSWGMRAGPRETIYFNPKTVKAAIVTCGGLCPGLNDVVRSLVANLEDYGVGSTPQSIIYGIRYGFAGFLRPEHPPIRLSSKRVDGIQFQGGTILGTSRGYADINAIVDKLEELEINQLFVVGGNGGNKGANAIHLECCQRGLAIAVIGIPKSVDNDILLIDRCFGFDTAVQEAMRVIHAAKVEAKSALHGVGLVKLMGRSSGFIAMAASSCSSEADLVLIPELDFELFGRKGAMTHLSKVMAKKGHAVVVVAEGAGQNFLGSSGRCDDSGNPILKDVGPWLKREIKDYFASEEGGGLKIDLKYIDPSYLIRATETTTSDKQYCN